MHAVSARFTIAAALCGALSAIAPAHAGDCDSVTAALEATARVPAIRQFLMSPKMSGGRERLMSITVGDTVYLSAGPPGQWRRMDRRDMMATAREEARASVYAECRRTGAESVDGTRTEIWEHRGRTGPVKVWIDAAGLVRKQQVGDTTMRYEFDDVRAPAS